MLHPDRVSRVARPTRRERLRLAKALEFSQLRAFEIFGTVTVGGKERRYENNCISRCYDVSIHGDRSIRAVARRYPLQERRLQRLRMVL
jgi:hypothetical protein